MPGSQAQRGWRLGEGLERADLGDSLGSGSRREKAGGCSSLVWLGQLAAVTFMERTVEEEQAANAKQGGAQAC